MISDWEDAYNDAMEFEGGYVNHPDDRGGETYKGIARKVFKNWPGWKILDEYKRQGLKTSNQINKAMIADKRIEPMVRQFYKEKFWDTVHGDWLPTKLSKKTFQTSINMGPHWGIALLQRALNGVNMELRLDNKPELFNQLEEDGSYGVKTQKAIDAVFKCYGKKDGQEKILDWYTEYQLERYKAIVRKNPSQQKFFKGWKRLAYYRGE